jgi:hypothetical protein
MPEPAPPAFWEIFARLRWVSLGCLMAFSLERFAYHVFDVGTTYHRSPTTLIWLFALPLAGFAFVLFRSPILSSGRPTVRVVALTVTSILLAVAYLQISFALFAFVVFSRIQWW